MYGTGMCTHVVGQIVPGEVTKFVSYGVFVEVAEGVEGLVHIAELADLRVTDPAKVVAQGRSDAASTSGATRSNKTCSTSSSRRSNG